MTTPAASGPCRCLVPLQIGELLAGMTPSAVRLDLQTRAYERCKEALAAAMPGAARADTEPWFGIPFLEAQVPKDLLRRCGLGLRERGSKVWGVRPACFLYGWSTGQD
jgi:hypothetical protein